MSQVKRLDSTTEPAASSMDSGELMVGQTKVGRIRAAQMQDLECLNRVIAAAMDSWRISDRVKRISLPLYCYDEDDLDFFQILVVENGDGDLLAVAALEQVDRTEEQPGQGTIVLHGIYVDPAVHGTGLGSSLLANLERIAAMQGYRTLIVKAKADSTGFFIKQGYEKLPVRDPNRDYPHTYSKTLDLRLTV